MSRSPQKSAVQTAKNLSAPLANIRKFCSNANMFLGDLANMSKALVIPKDVLNELRRLAVEAERNAALHDEAQKRYLKAGSDDIATSAKLAILLYDFTLKYASNPSLITAKLDELGLQYKKGTLVYYHICRLAVADVDDADTGRTSR
ncbi:hypothetical protein WDZ92_43885 [Nostoc sp. NIES-2111]